MPTINCAFFVVSLLVSLASTTIPGLAARTDSDPNDLVVAGYLPDYRTYINVNASSSLLTDLYLFSIEPARDGSVQGNNVCCLGKDHFRLLQQAKANSRNGAHRRRPLRVWVTIGGGGRSHHFPGIVGNDDFRKRFLGGLEKLW